MRTRESGRAAVIVAVVLVVVIVGVLAVAGGAAWYFWHSRSGPDFISAAVQMAPESSQIFLAVDGKKAGLSEATRDEALAALRQAKGFEALQKEVREKVGLELEGDILAALTPQMSLFVAPEAGKTSFLSDMEKSGPPPFRICLSLGLANKEKAEKALAAVETKAGTPYSTEKHAGITLHLPAVAGKGPVWAIDKSVLMVGAATADLKLAIDGSKGSGRSLGQSPRFQAAIARLKHKDALVVYSDLQGILAGELLRKIEQKEVRDLVGSLRHLVGGMSMEGRELLSEGHLVVDRKAGGALAAGIFKPDYGIEMKSLALVPAETEMFFALNLKMIWQMVYDVMGSSPEGRMMREAPAMQLAQQKVDLQKDIIDVLTGEIAVSLPNYSKVAEAQFGGLGKDASPAASMAAMQQLQAVILLPLARKEGLEALLEKPFIAPILSALNIEDYKGTPIRSQGAMFAYAIHGNTLVLGVQDGGQGVRKVIDGPGAASLASHPGRARLATLLGGSKPVFVSFTDTARVYGNAAKATGATDPGTAKLLQLMSRMGSSWQAAAIREDGLYFCGVTTDMKL